MAVTTTQSTAGRTGERTAASPPGPGWSWEPTLRACRDVARARAVVAIDGEGLPVAWVGFEDRVEAARISAHVAKSFDLLDRLMYVGRLAECMCIQYWPEGTWLTAVRVAPEVSKVVTVAVVGPYTLVQKDRQRLRNTFVHLLERTRID